jgi:hypothetical protein
MIVIELKNFVIIYSELKATDRNACQQHSDKELSALREKLLRDRQNGITGATTFI